MLYKCTVHVLPGDKILIEPTSTTCNYLVPPFLHARFAKSADLADIQLEKVPKYSIHNWKILKLEPNCRTNYRKRTDKVFH